MLKAAEVPPHARTQHVLTGYRPMGDTTITSAFFTLHNETANTWSHAFGALCSLFRIVATLRSPVGGLDARLSVCVFLLSATFAFSASACAHAFANVLPAVESRRAWGWDFIGIVVLIGGSYVPGIRWAFRCQPSTVRWYTAIVGSSLVASALLSLAPRRSSYTVANSLFLYSVVVSVSFGLVPLFHWCSIAPSDELHVMLPPALGMFACYGFGFLVFLYRYPERAAPGKFDYANSHTLWHAGVLGAVWCWDAACQRMLAMPWAGEDAACM